jgi:hypothetical protein
VTGVYNDQLIIPSEAVYSNDSIKYVYLKKKGIVRQIVDIGGENENYTIINKGLAEGDVLTLNEPEKPDDIKTVGWEIYTAQKIKIENEKRKLLESAKKEPSELNAGTGTVGIKSLNTK